MGVGVESGFLIPLDDASSEWDLGITLNYAHSHDGYPLS